MSERVKVVGNHPHRGATGTVVQSGAIRMKDGGDVMFRVALDQGDHSGQECFAEEEYLRDLPPEEDPYF